ncbi:hypothetical protein FRC05_005575 [Tulasnella sp. 425]|nr:hypothetical protein FRC05_005575 [Tulasnella sp. 425]
MTKWEIESIDAFVTEDATDLLDSIETTDDEFLEIQLRSDTQEQIELEVVAMSDERLDCSSPCNHTHHGSLDFDEAKVIEELADELMILVTVPLMLAQGQARGPE